MSNVQDGRSRVPVGGLRGLSFLRTVTDRRLLPQGLAAGFSSARLSDAVDDLKAVAFRADQMAAAGRVDK